MVGEEILEFMLVVALVVLPALAITARIALKPIVEAILMLREALTAGQTPGPGDQDEVTRLGDRIKVLESQVSRLEESEVFYRKLQEGDSPNELEGGREQRRTIG